MRASYVLIMFMPVSWGIEVTGFRDDRLARIESYRIWEVQRDSRPCSEPIEVGPKLRHRLRRNTGRDRLGTPFEVRRSDL
jgi:hypothetical protein